MTRNTNPASELKVFLKSLFAVCVIAAVVVLFLSFYANAQQPVLKYFEDSEFIDTKSGHHKMNREFLLKLDALRARCGFPLIINSGYRSPNHPDEIFKKKPGTHARGIAVDISAWNLKKKKIILKHAKALGFKGIGVYPGHVHLDMRKGKKVTWKYERYLTWQKI
tara:strand:- start:930 stop:1424 length:495 start_codon:yes stop_codon:yes gene_type:complete